MVVGFRLYRGQGFGLENFSGLSFLFDKVGFPVTDQLLRLCIFLAVRWPKNLPDRIEKFQQGFFFQKLVVFRAVLIETFFLGLANKICLLKKLEDNWIHQICADFYAKMPSCGITAATFGAGISEFTPTTMPAMELPNEADTKNGANESDCRIDNIHTSEVYVGCEVLSEIYTRWHDMTEYRSCQTNRHPHIL